MFPTLDNSESKSARNEWQNCELQTVTPSVLIVDDEALIVGLVDTIVSRGGFHSTGIADLEAAIDQALGL